MATEQPKSASKPARAQGKADATEERPVPSQAEGDRETIDEDLKEKLGSSFGSEPQKP